MIVFVVNESEHAHGLSQVLLERQVNCVFTNEIPEVELSLENHSVSLVLVDTETEAYGEPSFYSMVQNKHGVPVVILSRREHVDGINDYRQLESVNQILMWDVGPKAMATQIELAVANSQNFKLLQDRHDSVVANLTSQRETARVVNLYSHALNVDFPKAHNLLREYARRRRLTLTTVVDEHQEYMDDLSETHFYESIAASSEPPLTRDLRVQLAKASKAVQ